MERERENTASNKTNLGPFQDHQILQKDIGFEKLTPGKQIRKKLNRFHDQNLLK